MIMNGFRTPLVLLAGFMLLACAAAYPAQAAPAGVDPATSDLPPQNHPPPSAAISSRSPAVYPADGPTAVRVTILSAPQQRERANRLAILLLEYRRRDLEATLGLKLELANVSIVDDAPPASVIYYRPEFLRSALLLAEVVPGKQSVQPMAGQSLGKKGIDVEIWVGGDPS